ncbi:hypothetical protein RZS08_24085, partial [Arthrospira platensis SPKY1]|nr:hypothetical protein [Arthrospira platensis SPKY1]
MDNADLLAQVAPRVVPQLDAVQPDTAGGVVVKTGQQVDERRLSRTGGADQRQRPARLHVEAHAAQ